MGVSAFYRGASALALAVAGAISAQPAVAQVAPSPSADATASSPDTAASAASPADPADAAAPDAAAPMADREIIVTGTRLGRTGYNSPTPVNVVGSERLRALAIPNIADALNQIPSFRAISSPATNFVRVSGNIAARTLDLRGLGSTRTLTLVDGQRFVAGGDNGTVDLNSIPSIMVQRAEIVTGGASAAYGANAVAGVVNLLLDTKFSGLKTDMNAGISQRGDAENFYVAAKGGTDFAGGRGHIVAGAEYAREYGIGACENRNFCNKYTNYIANPGYNATTRVSTNGLPATLVLNDVMFVYNTNSIVTGAVTSSGKTLGQQLLNTPASGTYLPDVLRGKQFDSNGNLVPYTFGNYLSGIFQQIRDTTQPYNLGASLLPLYTPSRHFSGIVHATYDLTDTIVASSEFLYSHVVGGPTQSQVPFDSPAIDINNPFVSAATRAAVLAADPTITKIVVNSASLEAGTTNYAITTIDTYRAVLGLKGQLGKNWDWDAAYSYGRVHGYLDDQRVKLNSWTSAIDVIAAPAGNSLGVAAGTPICRVAIAATNPDPSCIPINLFGPNSVSAAALAKYIVAEWQTRTFQQHNASANLRGSPFATWAGDVRVAIGAEWRRDTAVGHVDPLTLSGQVFSPQASVLPFTRTTVVEGYVEASVPLLRDSALGKSLVVDGALRQTHYNPFGNATTWKVGAVYSPISDITFRVTQSRDIRAPTPAETNPNVTIGNSPLPDPFLNNTHNQLIVAGGNPDLHLERGDTFTAGVVLKPSFAPRFNLSLDYYNIKVKGAIDTLTGSAIANACFQQNRLCDLIVFTGAPKASAISTIYTTYQNLSQLHAEGFELVADYSLPLLNGNLAFQVNGNYVIDLSTLSATGVRTQFDNWTGNNGSVANIQGVPRWKLDGVVTYARDAWSLTAHGRYIPRALLDTTKIGAEQPGYDINLPNSATLNHVSSRFYLDLSATVKVAETPRGKVEVYGQVSNVFDTTEPRQLRYFGNPLQFDPVLRAFRIGVRTSW